ncbi:MAG: hypothetical protein RLZZ338_4722 [Cyanobacteriota bacterium]|jgi:hypothetical protein
MLWAKNKANFSVIFTEDPADQTLLAAIDNELSLTQYQTFSNLCKQALWQFLSISESGGTRSSDHRLEERIIELQQKWAEFERKIGSSLSRPQPAPPPIQPLSLPPFPSFEPLETRLIELQEHFAKLERDVNAQDLRGFQTLQRQLTEVSQQLSQLQVSVNNAQFAPVPIAVEPLVLNDDVEVPSPPPEETSAPDPVLSRVMGFLDDF